MAGAAHAQTVNGGGSTLASPTYLTEFNFYGNASPTTDFSGYAPSGSGAAITAVLTNTANVSGGPVPFDFGASDATMTEAQVNSWNASTTTGKVSAGLIVQVPSIGTPITIPVDFANATSNTAINLSDAQLCGLFSGKITNSSDSLLAGSGIAADGSTITVGYRLDGSGTSFLFTQHLAAVCTSSTSNIAFTATTSFASLFPFAPGSTSVHALPSNFTGGTGSPGVQATVVGTQNSVGYLSPDYTREVALPNPSTAKSPYVAEVNGIQPTPGNTSTALALGTPAVDGNLNTTGKPYNPADPVSFVPVSANPSKGYPIVGFTTFVLPQCFSDPSVAATLKSFVSDLYSNGTYQSVIRKNGFTPVPGNVAGQVSSAYLLANTNSSTINGAGVGGCATVVGR